VLTPKFEEAIVKLAAAVMLCLLTSVAAQADEAAQCQANGGTFLSGNVVAPPKFVRAREHRRGVALSHTHLTLLADQDGQSYDVAIDNVFAAGYDAGPRVPMPLSSIRTGERLEVCGKLYTHGGPGIDWVHTNCGEAPSSGQPDGWVNIVAADGNPGPNLEASQEYCRLWQ
jgi:hypothetical protein